MTTIVGMRTRRRLIDPTLFRSLLALSIVQFCVSLIVFSDFLSGKKHFAYLDIGIDSYIQFAPYAMYLARAIVEEGFTGWSFQLGLGGPTMALLGDLASLLGQLVGSEHILPVRILVYLLKVALGGTFFLLLIRCFVTRWESAVVSAVAYSFCGFMLVNGQWDGEATAFVFYPLVLWAIVRCLRVSDILSLPIAIAAALFFGTFFVSVGVFLGFACMVCVAFSDKPKAMALDWIRKVFPLAAIGYLLATPYVLPVVLQLMDSSRVSGAQSLVQSILSKSLAVSDWQLIIAQVGGIFHKDVFGVGSGYRGYFNYLEGPGFYFSLTLFVLIPQLWAGSSRDRRLLVVGCLVFVAYVLFPVFRFAAMGFAAPYFRVSTLWITVIGLLLATRALDRVLIVGVDLRLLAAGVLTSGALLLLVVLSAPPDTIWFSHVWRVIGIISLATLVLALSHRGLITSDRMPIVFMLLTVLEAVLIARPSFVHGRSMVDSKVQGYNDRTLAALAEIRKIDSGVFRIEKDYHSVSLADAMAQDYMGIKSYSLHSRGMVDFHIGAGLLPTSSSVVNYSNWLSNAGDRFVLNSLLGVKYFIAANPVTWPGFVEVSNSSGLRIYRNEAALPLAVVQTRQVSNEAFGRVVSANLANKEGLIDAILFNAAVVDRPVEGYGEKLEIDAWAKQSTFSLEDLYFSPATRLQNSGLRIQHFSSNRIVGEINPSRAGILAFSIPFSSGWRLRIDGVETPMFRVNFGMLGAAVSGGRHSVELDFVIPGLRLGQYLGAVAFLILAGMALFQYRKVRTS